ncbi:terminase gpA endonuclease subunit, partial [Limnohabitans sp.]|uniref:terminase gpA endonuclease subunit n=1 Tax=Limnohabitans sp. TaxID=1907725 RepID=UPI00386211D3
IFTSPRTVDLNKKNKAQKFGLQVFMVGTSRAKDTIIENRLKLTGTGAGRLHWYATVRADYWDQLVSEVKAPHRSVKNKKVWMKKAGKRNEALDCEVYALHAARSLKTNLMRPAHWAAFEARLRQHTLLSDLPEQTAAPTDTSEESSSKDEEMGADTPVLDQHETAAPAPVQTPTPKPTPIKRRVKAPKRHGGWSSNNW